MGTEKSFSMPIYASDRGDKEPGSDCDHHHDDEKLIQEQRVLKEQKRQHGKPTNDYKKGNPDQRKKPK
jgi:hypothetical protein